MSAVVFFVSLGLFSSAIHANVHPDVIEMRNVHVLDKNGPTSFWADVESNGVRNRFYLNFCDYSRITPEIQPGVTMNIWYMEDRVHGNCYDVSPGSNRGYTLRRDQHGKPMLTDWKVDANTRSSATSCATEAAAGSF